MKMTIQQTDELFGLKFNKLSLSSLFDKLKPIFIFVRTNWSTERHLQIAHADARALIRCMKKVSDFIK